MASIINSTDTGGGGLITTGDSSDELQLQTAETARVTLTNTAVVVNEDGNDLDFRVEGDTDANLLFVDAGNDRVGVGTSSPGYNLDVKGTIATTYSTTVKGGFTAGSSSVFLSTLTNHPLIFETNGSERMRLNTSGNLAFPNGGGIDFSASAGVGASSSILDDYEEGTFTVTTNSDATGAILTEDGEYTKIGNVCIARVVFRVATNFTSNSIGGLPFSPSGSSTTSNVNAGCAVIVSASGNTPVLASVSNSFTSVAFYVDGTTATAHNPNTTNLIYRLTVVYRTA